MLSSAIKQNSDVLQQTQYFFDELNTESREYDLLNNLPDDHDLVDTPFIWTARQLGMLSNQPEYRQSAKDVLDFIEICQGFIRLKN